MAGDADPNTTEQDTADYQGLYITIATCIGRKTREALRAHKEIPSTTLSYFPLLHAPAQRWVGERRGILALPLHLLGYHMISKMTSVPEL